MAAALLVPVQAAEAPCTRSAFHREARRVYRSITPVTRSERRRIRRRVMCLKPKSRRIVRFHLERYKRHHGYRRAIAAVTPYRGGGSTWAIPYGIVLCESRGSWAAANPSGAIGPYQLLRKGAPWPVRGIVDRLSHHRIAFRLYAGGAGRSHWVC